MRVRRGLTAGVSLRAMTPLPLRVASIHGGDAMNVIPEHVRMTGTFRSLSNQDLLRVKRRIQEIATGIGAANRCDVAVTYPIPEFPPTSMTRPRGTSCAAPRKASLAPRTFAAWPVLGGEDFAFYQQRISGAFAFIGASHADWQTRHNVHHPKFKVDDEALPIGAALHVAMALEALGARHSVSVQVVDSSSAASELTASTPR
jgi:metal-dependent amidase/aminoacylase/carboxypeptidase family protein